MDENKNILTTPTIEDTHMITNMPIPSLQKIKNRKYQVFSETDPPLAMQSSPSSSSRSGTSENKLDFLDQEYFGIDDAQ